MKLEDIEDWRFDEILPYPNIKVPGSLDHHCYRFWRPEDSISYVLDYCLAPYFETPELKNEYGVFFSISKMISGIFVKVKWTDVVICMKILMDRKLKVPHPGTLNMKYFSNGLGLYVMQNDKAPLQYVEL